MFHLLLSTRRQMYVVINLFLSLSSILRRRTLLRQASYRDPLFMGMPAKGCFRCKNNDSGPFKNRKYTCILHDSCTYTVNVRKRQAEDFWRVTASNTRHTANLNFGSQEDFDAGKKLPPVFKYMIYQVLLNSPTVKKPQQMVDTIRFVLGEGNGFPLIEDEEALQKFNDFRTNKIRTGGTGTFNKMIK